MMMTMTAVLMVMVEKLWDLKQPTEKNVTSHTNTKTRPTIHVHKKITQDLGKLTIHVHKTSCRILGSSCV